MRKYTFIIIIIVLQSSKINAKMIHFIAIRKEIIFCRCGSYFWWFRIIFQPVPHHQLCTEIAVPKRCGGAEVPTSGDITVLNSFV